MYSSVCCLAAALLPLGAMSRNIHVSLSAPWPTTCLSPIQEVSEYLSEESSADFWGFAKALRTTDAVAAIDKADSEPYSEAGHEQISSMAVELAASLLSPLQLSALRLTLSVRSFAPLVETHRSLALLSAGKCGDGSSAWVVLRPSGRVVCDPSKLAEAAKAAPGSAWPTVTGTAEAPRPSVDHYFAVDGGLGAAAAAAAAAAESATLYGRLGSSSFWAFHDELAPMLEAGSLGGYTFRHGVPPLGSTTTTALQGYGVNLDIKNMEYNMMDDGGAAAAGGAAVEVAPEDVSFAEGEEAGGFVFSTLHERRPELGPKLAALRKEVSEGGDEELKVWKMKDLGLQAAAAIAADKDPLQRLAALASDFPVHATALARTKVAREVRAEAERSVVALSRGALGGGGSTLFVNGRPVVIDLPSFNLFSLLRTIRSESRLLAKLGDLRLPRDTAAALLELGAQGGAEAGEGAEVRVDIVSGSKGAICFLNNLEKDAQYKRWPRSLRQLMYPSWNLHTLARNLYTMVLVVDPTTAGGLVALQVGGGVGDVLKCVVEGQGPPACPASAHLCVTALLIDCSSADHRSSPRQHVPHPIRSGAHQSRGHR